MIATMVTGVVMVALEPSRLPSLPQPPETSALGRGTSVIQVSVAMHVPYRDAPRSILSVLHRLALNAQTESREGIQDLVSDAAMELLRRKSSVVSACAASKHFQRREHALREYGLWSARERSKFEQETDANYGGNKKLSSSFPLSDGSTLMSESAAAEKREVVVRPTLAVVTLLLAIDGDKTRPPAEIRSLESIEDALQKIVVDAKTGSCLRSAEVLWTPSGSDETLTALDVTVDYPQLRPV